MNVLAVGEFHDLTGLSSVRVSELKRRKETGRLATS